MNRYQYRDFSVICPADWSDRSTILLLAPKQYEDTPTLKKQALPRENIVIERQTISEQDREPYIYLQSRLDKFQRELENYKIIQDIKPLSHNSLPGVSASYSFIVEQMPIRQLHAVLFSETEAFHIVGTSVANRYPDVEDHFWEVINSFSM